MPVTLNTFLNAMTPVTQIFFKPTAKKVPLPLAARSLNPDYETLNLDNELPSQLPNQFSSQVIDEPPRELTTFVNPTSSTSAVSSTLVMSSTSAVSSTLEHRGLTAPQILNPLTLAAKEELATSTVTTLTRENAFARFINAHQTATIPLTIFISLSLTSPFPWIIILLNKLEEHDRYYYLYASLFALTLLYSATIWGLSPLWVYRLGEKISDYLTGNQEITAPSLTREIPTNEEEVPFARGDV